MNGIIKNLEFYLNHKATDDELFDIWNKWRDNNETDFEIYKMCDFDEVLDNIFTPTELFNVYKNSLSVFNVKDPYFLLRSSGNEILSADNVADLIENRFIEDIADYMYDKNDDFGNDKIRFILNSYGLKYDTEEGYYYISKNGIKYDLLEGKALYGEKTSDMIIIMRDYYDCLDDENAENDYVTYIMGATFFKDSIKEYTEIVENAINKYEVKNARIIEQIKINRQKNGEIL